MPLYIGNTGAEPTRVYWGTTRISKIYSGANLIWEDADAPPPAGSPPAPTGLSAIESPSGGRFSVTWNASAGATSYILAYKKVDDTDWTEITNTDRSELIRNLDAGTTYNLRVRGVNSFGNGAWSPTISPTTRGTAPTQPDTPTPPPTPGSAPGVPGRPTLTVSGTTLNASWTAVTGATSYGVQYRAGSSRSWTRVSRSSTSWSLSGTRGTTYQVRVQAVNSFGSSGYSSIASRTIPRAAVPVPTGRPTLTFSASGLRLSASWTAVSGATYYVLSLRTAIPGQSVGLWTTRNITSGTSTSFNVSLYSTRYEARITPGNSGGLGGSATQSASAYATTGARPAVPPPTVQAPPTPTGLSVSVSGRTLSITWNSAARATSYTTAVRAVTPTTGVWDRANTTGTSRSFTGAYSTRYEVWVLASNSGGNSGWSTGVFATTEADPTAVPAPTSAPTDRPTFLSRPRGWTFRQYDARRYPNGGTSFFLEWNPVARATVYDVRYYKSNPRRGGTLTRAVSGTSVTISSIPGSEYVYQVRGRNSVGAGPWTSLRVARTIDGIGAAWNANLRAVRASNGVVTASWSAVTPPAGVTFRHYEVTYTIRRNNPRGDWGYRATFNAGSSTSFTITGASRLSNIDQLVTISYVFVNSDGIRSRTYE